MIRLALPDDVAAVLRELNPWWSDGAVKPAPPGYRRPPIDGISARLRGSSRLIEAIRGPRQVGKTTGLQQIVEDLLRRRIPASEILFGRTT